LLFYVFNHIKWHFYLVIWVTRFVTFMTFEDNSSLFNKFVCKLGLFWHEWASLKREWNERFKGPRVPKKAQFTHERVEYNVFLFDEPFKITSLKIFKISLTFHFDKLWHLSKSAHTGENSQILTVSNKKGYLHKVWVVGNDVGGRPRCLARKKRENSTGS
jgi:hypothetical protein